MAKDNEKKIEKKIKRTNRGTMKSRELSFFLLQALIPALFALLPVGLTLVTVRDDPVGTAFRRLADGTIILVAFTMLISLSQDLKESVRPNIHAQVGKLEILLRGGAIGMIGVYAFYQSVAVLSNGTRANMRTVETWLTIFAFAMLILSMYVCYITLRTLRPHFNREE